MIGEAMWAFMHMVSATINIPIIKELIYFLCIAGVFGLFIKLMKVFR